MLAAHVWVAGGIVLVVGRVVAALGARALHQLAAPWVVFVPAGMVLVDCSRQTDALLVQRFELSIQSSPVDRGRSSRAHGPRGRARHDDGRRFEGPHMP